MSKFIMLSLTFVLSVSFIQASAANAQVPPTDCPVFDYKCQENQRTNCKAWDYLCDDAPGDCPAWDSSCRKSTPYNQANTRTEQITYSEKVSCTLVLEEMFGGISGYCQESFGANLSHCIVDNVGLFDPYSVEFLCADGRPNMMAIASRNEVRVDNLGQSVVFGNPFWIICDEGMGPLATNKRCYDSEFSDRDDWEVTCKVDKRLNTVYDYPDTFQWYVCP